METVNAKTDENKRSSPLNRPLRNMFTHDDADDDPYGIGNQHADIGSEPDG